MKRYCILLLLLFYSATSHASNECVSELSSSSKYGDLNKILACFIKKIEVSETQIKALKTQIEELEEVQKSEFMLLADRMLIAKNSPENDQDFNGDATVIKPAIISTAIQTVEVAGLTFKLLNCSRKRKEEIVCELSIASNIDTTLIVNPRNFYSQYFTIAISTSGVQYSAAWTSLGASGQDRSASYRMLSGIPLTSLVNFSSVPRDEKGFALLEILTSKAKVQFRDVSFTDQE